MRQTVGIDLGTTNTVAAANAGVLGLREGEVVEQTLPSVVAYPPSGQTLVGEAARQRRSIDPKNTLFSAKRVMGERWHSYRTHQFRENYPFDLVKTGDSGVAFQTRAGTVTAVDVATRVVQTLCERAAVTPGDLEAVVTVPASFGDPQRSATLEAVRAAGFADVRCIAEPVATALAYLDRNDVHYGAVYDLGGGTFDMAILDCRVSPIGIVAHEGDPYLGGDDIDHAIASWVADFVLREKGWDLRNDSEVFGRLVLESERAKIRLTKSESTVLDLSQVDEASPRDISRLELGRGVLWELSAPLLGRTFGICDEVLSGAGLRADDIQAVFLAGGATLMPGVREAVREYFGPKVRSELNPMHVVSLGASIAAARASLSGLLHTR